MLNKKPDNCSAAACRRATTRRSCRPYCRSSDDHHKVCKAYLHFMRPPTSRIAAGGNSFDCILLLRYRPSL